MPMTASEIVDMIKEAIPDAQVDITDLRAMVIIILQW